MVQIRHGDVWIEAVEAWPQDVQAKAGSVLAYGEVTGHAHRLATEGLLYEAHDGTTYLRVPEAGTVLTHEEHGPVLLPAGDYMVRIQREYDPYGEAVRWVVD